MGTVARIDGHHTDSTLDINVGLKLSLPFLYLAVKSKVSILIFFKEYRLFMEGKKKELKSKQVMSESCFI